MRSYSRNSRKTSCESETYTPGSVSARSFGQLRLRASGSRTNGGKQTATASTFSFLIFSATCLTSLNLKWRKHFTACQYSLTDLVSEVARHQRARTVK